MQHSPMTKTGPAVRLRDDRAVLVAILTAWVFRGCFFVGAILWPISNENGNPVSPLLQQSYYDFQFYLDSLARYEGAWSDIFFNFIRFYQDPLSPAVSLISGPVFPALISLTLFEDGTYLPMALLYLAISCGLVAAWLVWLRRKGVGAGWLLIFALIPNPVWLTLVVSPDLLFAALFAAFFFLYFDAAASRAHVTAWIVCVVLMLLTHPNGFSVLVFIALHTSWSMIRDRRAHAGRFALIVALLVLFGVYLFPYFYYEMSQSSTAFVYFGWTSAEHLRGVFAFLPPWLDLPISWLRLAAAKLMYFVGLRPSYGETATVLVVARAAAGVILLPGLVTLFLRAPPAVRVLTAIYCLPILLGPSQDRYYLPVYPLFFFYGVMAYEAAWRWRGSLRRVRTQP
jgi:hypothetical protein